MSAFYLLAHNNDGPVGTVQTHNEDVHIDFPICISPQTAFHYSDLLPSISFASACVLLPANDKRLCKKSNLSLN